MSFFAIMVDRIATELRRSNLTDSIKNAVNDAIKEASDTRFYLNEMRGITFNTVPGQEYYPDLGIVGIDSFWYLNGTSRMNLILESNLAADLYASGNVTSGQLSNYSRQGNDLRLYPIPNAVVSLTLEGYGRLSPYPLVEDSDTNAWMTEGELYIRALAKRNIWRDVIRDYGEARVADAIAEDYKNQLLEKTSQMSATGVIKATQW